MSGSYMQCPECGKRALSIATRCPGCGREFPPKPERHKGLRLDFGRYFPPVAVVAVLAAGAALITATLDRPARPPVLVEEETSSVAAAPRLEAASPAPAPTPPAGELRVARTWTKVRIGRSTRADLAAVLLPGDTVTVDSLSHGWYRVALEGEVLGYSHESTLGAAGPKR
jgi:hypothetical protein